jgi:hypothetical protein
MLMGGYADIVKLIIDFQNFANASKTEFLLFREHMVAIIRNKCLIMFWEVRTYIHGVGKIQSL